MRTLLHQIFLSHWPRKLVAFFTALVIWTLVNNSITTVRTVANVPVRIVQIPVDKTIDGLMPDGTLSRRVTLTLRGAKATLDSLDPADMEIVLDAAGKGDEWVADITKRNLVSLNPEVDLLHDISSVDHTEIVIKLSRLVTAKIPVNIPLPDGEAPKGYQYLGTWPTRLYHTLSGPEDQLSRLQAQGLELRFDLNEVSKEGLDRLETAATAGHEGEVHLLVPPAWKKVAIPYLGNSLEPINDPEAKNLRMEFLRQELIALDRPIPILVFYPERYSETVNPDTYRLAISGPVQRIRGIPHLNLPLYLKNVSRLFVEVIKDQLTLTVIAAPRKEKELLDWTLHVINPKALEDAYVKRFSGAREGTLPKQEEQHIRRRFNTYLRAMELYQAENQPLDLRISLQGANIQVQAPIMEQQTQPAAPPAATKE